MPWFWVAPDRGEWFGLVLMGLLGASGHLMLIRAFHLAPAAGLSPWLNIQILAASLYGIGIFGDRLTLHFLLGGSLVVLGGILVWRIRAGEQTTARR